MRSTRESAAQLYRTELSSLCIAGKSTLLKLLAGDMYLDDGELYVINETGTELLRTNRGRTRQVQEAHIKSKQRAAGSRVSAGGSRHSVASPAQASAAAAVEQEETGELDTSRICPEQEEAVRVGFCPQTDALYEFMTVAQNLHTFGLLRGMRGNRLDELVHDALELFRLGSVAQVAARQLG